MKPRNVCTGQMLNIMEPNMWADRPGLRGMIDSYRVPLTAWAYPPSFFGISNISARYHPKFVASRTNRANGNKRDRVLCVNLRPFVRSESTWTSVCCIFLDRTHAFERNIRQVSREKRTVPNQERVHYVFLFCTSCRRTYLAAHLLAARTDH